LTIAALFLRRPDQFFHPYIWVEDAEILPAYAERGLASIVEPVVGYHILASKIIALTACKTSIIWAPEIALALVVTFTCAVVAAIAFSSTHLSSPFLCALAVLAIPSDPEVFAISEYAFWWAGLLLLLALLWDVDRGAGWLPLLYVVVGGLSSPLVIPFAALFAVRAFLERRRSEYVVATTTLGIACVQALTVLSQAKFGGTASLTLSTARIAADKFAGVFPPLSDRILSRVHRIGVCIRCKLARLRATRSPLRPTHARWALRHCDHFVARASRGDRSGARWTALLLLSVHHLQSDGHMDRRTVENAGPIRAGRGLRIRGGYDWQRTFTAPRSGELARTYCRLCPG